MAGLVSYGSSEEEDNVQENMVQEKRSDKAPINHKTNGITPETQSNGSRRQPSQAESTIPLPKPDAPLAGPVIGPTVPTDDSLPMVGLLEEDQETGAAPQSPYSANRALLRDLTLPTLPNYDIPPSPPGSPVGSTNAKFKHFLELKKQGIHFNEKLAKSSALKNPSLMQKLMDFSDIDEAGQYVTTLPRDLWNPDAFPAHAYKEELAKNQQKTLKRKEDEKSRGQRESVDFVPASASGEPASRSGTPGNGVKPSQKSAAERIMAGLDRNLSSSPRVQGVKRKSRFDS
ncbi:Meiotically up-regulated protein [Lachnellula hyalina]|uniref:Meiotically up-regulated protein n=1 Tax=Lachnellula hyalina TaxID=1316788 RepID=A0A8H8TY22_9HELO|nr:Meiotically up-regulated protein [Lachnellula hyalina]TVY23516.1 Meiotically up-regulated protein [Lachnellula hyalina]